jgi:methionine-rich copper-binding protein CopC
MRVPSTTTFVVVFCVTVPGQALAHAHLKSASPNPDATVAASPSELDLTFSEGIELKFSGAKIVGGAAAATGQAAFKQGDDTTLVVPIAKPLPAGVYTVDWHVLSKDGHKTQGSYRFTIRP